MNYKLIKWNFIILVVFLILLEFILYLIGYERGFIDNNQHFKVVNQLKILEGYNTDEDGIQKIAPSVRTFIEKNITDKNNAHAILSLDNSKYNIQIFNLSKDFVNIHLGKHKNGFYHYMNNEGAMDPAIFKYYNSPINSQGFRSIEFKNHQTEKKKVLLLGDSFTFGHSTKNKTDSFADILLSKNHLVYNTGIIGADIPQYETIVNKYIDNIKPDIVIANIYLGNDINKFERIPSKEIPIFYSTNAGNLYSCSTGIYFNSADSIYNHIIKMSSIPQDKYFDIIMSKTRVTTQIWLTLSNFKIFSFGPWTNEYSNKFWNDVDSIWDKNGYSPNRKYLENIDSICQANNATFITSIIPENNNFKIKRDDIDILLDGYQKYHLEDGYIKSDFSERDGHFNEAGHQKYADYLDELIQNIPK